ncbi:E3 ubiquitin-protein ligase rnf213-alpha-like [Eucyclogobius newberryi]|uniref:E3 ubiquitin-protein ligase rnf213-alpha-like n=1 Tax=Eucyclogobius newberryi TaxID=166745 RepID=UPI003B591B8B
MKCPACKHNILEKKPKFCSECGTKLSIQPAVTQDPDTAAPDDTVENDDKSPKRLNENANPKKKKKKRKKGKKKKDDNMSTDTDQSDMSLVPTDDNKDTRSQEGDGSDSESSVSIQELSSLDDRSTSGKSATAGVPQENMEVTEQSDAVSMKSPANQLPPSEPMEEGEADTGQRAPDDDSVRTSEETQVVHEKMDMVKKDTKKHAEDDQTQENNQTQSPTQGKAAPTPQPDSDKSTKANDQSDSKTNNKKNKKNKNKEDSSTPSQSQLDQNANEETNDELNQGEKKQEEKKQEVNQTEKPPSPSEPMVEDETNVKQIVTDDGTTVASGDMRAVNEKTTTVKGNAQKQSKKEDQTKMSKKTQDTAPKISQPGSDKETNTNNQNDTRTNEKKNTKNKKESDSKQHKQNPNVNVELNEKTAKETKRQENNKGKVPDKSQTGNTKQKMVFGPNSETKSSGSSVDQPAATVKQTEVQQSGTSQASTEKQMSESSDPHKATEDDAWPTKAAQGPQKPKKNKPVDAKERLVINFHAVLSKDFNIDPNRDEIYIQAGERIGSWGENIAELNVTRDLGEHGFLVEGELETIKSKATSGPLPYKYVVYRAKKRKYEFEFIYKLDNNDTTNRCLFVKDKLLNSDGAWHQYDDIICAEPERGIVNYLKEKFNNIWSQQKRNLIQGREIAGQIQLETIFDLLKDWSDVNLKNFLTQLNQFFEVYSNPFVYEKRQVKWESLGFAKEEVKKLLKNFMLYKMIPQLLKNQEGSCLYVQDPLRAAVIMLSVCSRYGIPLDNGELSRLCIALSLPQLHQEDFVKYWERFSHDAVIFPNLTEIFISLINLAIAERLPHWILVVPTVHLLKRIIKPYDALVSNNAGSELHWAGLEDIQNIQNIQNMNSQSRKSLVNLMKSHLHLKEIDVLVVRSWLHLISISELLDCNISLQPELLDILHIFNTKIPKDISFSNFEDISNTITHIHENLKGDKYSAFTETYRKQCLGVAVKLLDKIGKAVGVPKYYANYTGILVSCMHLVASVSDFVSSATSLETSDTVKEQASTKDCLSTALVIISKKMSQCFQGSVLKDTHEIEMWNSIFSVKFKDDICTSEWRDKLTKDFEGRYKQESAMKQIDYYCAHIEGLRGSQPYIASCIEGCALDAVTSVCQTKSEGKIIEKISLHWFGKFEKLISAIVEKSWPKQSGGDYCDDEETILRHLLSWTASKKILQLYVGEKGLAEKLSDAASERIVIAVSAFDNVVDQVVQGNLKIGLLNIILEKRVAFLELIEIEGLTEKTEYKNPAKMRRLLQQRQNELNAVDHEKRLVDCLVAMSNKLEEFITVDVDDIKKRQRVNIEEIPLNTFMEVHLFDQISSDKAGTVTYFNLNEDIRDMAEKMYTFRDSHLFKVCWEQHVRAFVNEENSDDAVSLERIHEEIFLNCFDEYKVIYSSLKNGSITLERINDLFIDYKGKYQELVQDLEIMCSLDRSDDNQWVHNRVQQIEQFHELHMAVASAEIIMKVKRSLGVQGDFSILENLIQVNQENLKRVQLSQIDNDLIRAKKDLVDITQVRKDCLRELGLRGNFVRWVKEALEDINELKVFVDLASISAGENDMDVDRVACFHDAVLGYSSMLYELKQDSDFHNFNIVVQKLWKALDNDPNLPKKLRDSARHLEWLKTVKESHGSVELSSLSLASSINKKGIYVISAQSEKKLSLDEVLKLQITEEHDDGRQIRHYSLEDLRELQNKLMLMSGKGDQGQHEVEHFTEVFESVQRLSEAFIALYSAGNPLFRHWEAQISCCTNGMDPSIMMDFNLGGAFSAVLIEGSLEGQLPDLCRRIETCLTFWMDFVAKQRSQHYYLNYYTAEQIVYLCSHLSQQNVSHVDDQVLMMLSFVKPDCSTADLRQVWHELQYEILNQPQDQNEDIEFQTFTMVESKSSDFGSEFDLLPSLIQQASGLQKFDVIWNTYMKDMKGSLPDVIDLRTLGRLLEILANVTESEGDEDISDANFTICVSRKLPNGLNVGKPNLIICPHEDILTSCISTYMSSKDESLPTQDEVLLCTSTTPYEQVELFLRRCLSCGYRGDKIYSLLYADVLTYDVSSKAESFFQSLNTQSRRDYRLIIFCSSEREHAYLPSAFSQYKVHMVPQAPLARIKEYLHDHYVVPEGHCSAAAAFKDRLCVGIVSSRRAGVGKSLYIKRLYQKLKHSTKKTTGMNCIRLIEPTVDEDAVLQSLLNQTERKALTVFHFDVTSSVQRGLHEFLFKLLFLRCLMDSEGKVWKCNEKQLYVVEILDQSKVTARQAQKYSFTDVFPNIFCRPPKEVLEIELRKNDDLTIFNSEDPLMDDEEFRSPAFQRSYQYLIRFHTRADLDRFTYNGVEGSHGECLQMLLMHCGIVNPSWAELRNFAWFLNLQLQDSETSVFCNAEFVGDTLVGFKRFVVDFMILMAKDFATPSLSISDQSPGMDQVDLTGVREEDLAPFLIRKRWETEPHPYIFFNDDHESITFIGFHLQPNNHNSVDAIDPASGRVIKRNVMTIQLYDGLRLQRVPFNIDFDQLPRGEKIERMCSVLGIQWPLDPDETYELTTDNILKILAIHMRFRCGIPVIIMGETGCGKTRLIKFLCELRKSGVATENMKLVKVHGGTTSSMIYTKVREAESMAAINKQDYGFDSVLFFDEANTTEAISSIKEVLCDKTVQGEDLTSGSGLHIIAACNPYRKHTDEMIERLESAGLGYRVRAEETDEKLGSIPLRQLVYRVHALPPSMIPLVWDFGQLNDDTEKIYIQQIVQRVIQRHDIRTVYSDIIVNVLSASQQYMRKRKDECSFVSLRDVERCMLAFVWFLNNHAMYFNEFDSNQSSAERDAVLWSLVMATGVCYHACLENKEDYRQIVSRKLPPDYTPLKMQQEIILMQDLFLNGVPMGDTIARNNALKENVFMMVLCIELRIPLFLVGKPGSSKSLSKTLVADAMQGQSAHSDIYKRLKQIHLVSFQCSPHSTPEGIINTFKQCGRFQEGKNLKEYISVVVLDEIGLAEDSPKMPLKTLHPLLEEGCIDDEPLPHKKVGFIGISNWALDPAKMNRGIFVSRGDPDEKELIESAKGICSSDKRILEMVRDFFKPFARAYLEICRRQGNGFFGLRDYYSLIKMIFAVAKISQRKLSAEEIIKAVLRNFSGRVDVDAVSVFKNELQITPNLDNISAIEFVKENLKTIGQDEECRYLLLLTKNYAALQILQQTFFKESGQPEIIFGSSFPKDQQYTQICRNINKVKICMETGQTVVLLNLQNLYESLYDALNQYYVFLGGQKYVDLGLGTHRVKCRVHKDFRLIVIEEREIVYKQFPIPLINRLEKHFLDIHTVLKAEQKTIVKELVEWVKLFVSLGRQQGAFVRTHKYNPADVFIGYHSDTCASVVLQVLENQNDIMEMIDPEKNVLDAAKLVLLKCATPDSVVRLDCSELPRGESEHLAKVYSEEQNNGCLSDYILAHVMEEQLGNSFFTEMTTFSRLLTTSDLKPLEQNGLSAELLSVQQFDTEHSFLKKIRHFLTGSQHNSEPNFKVLIVQCDYDEASQSANLVASAKYSSINEIRKIILENTGHKVFVYFISRLPRMVGGTSYVGFHGGPWRSVHIDDLRRSNEMVSDLKILQRMTISQLFENNMRQPEAMEVDDEMYMETEQENTDSEKNQNQDMDTVLDTTMLVRSCVQSAVGMLRDQMESGFRSTRRVEILLTLLDDDHEIKEGFNKIIKRHLHALLATHVDNTLLSKNNWVMKEASNIDALQEGGTFRNTLWKRVQAVVVPMLAHLIAISDCDKNLDLLLDTNCGTSLKNLWLDIFGNDKLLQIPPLSQDPNSESRTILVQNYITPKMMVGCSMPFSWRIRDYLEDMWVHALHHEGQTQLQFDDFFWKTPLGLYIGKEDQDTQTEFYQRYLQDYVSLTMNVTCEEEMQLLSGALYSCVNELKIKLEATERPTSLSWVHAAYHEFKSRLQNLSRMICIEPQVTGDILRNPSSRDGPEMVLDVYAAFACVEHLEPTSLNTHDQRQTWLRQVHKLQIPIELVCSEDSVRFYGARSKTIVSRVQDAWNRIFCLSLFVEHMLVGIEELEHQLVPEVLDHTQKLWKILERNTDMKTKDAFEAVIGLLKSCKDKAVECIFRFGLPQCSVCIGDPQDPICLPCQHIYCLHCIKQWLVLGQMYCPYCIQPVNDDFQVLPSDAIRIKINIHAQFRRRCNAFFVEFVSSMCFKDNSPPTKEVIQDLLSFLLHEAKPALIPGAHRRSQIVTKEFSPFDESLDKSPVVRSVVLKLLLKYSFDEIKKYLKRHLHVVEESNLLDDTEKTELYLLYINCFEDSMFEKLCLKDESSFLAELLLADPQALNSATVDCMQLVARVRLDLDMAAGLIIEETTTTETQDRQAASDFLKSVKDLCTLSGNNWYRIYLIRKTGTQHGVESVQNLLKVQQMSWLFPDEIRQKTEAAPMDLFLVCGPDYQTIRNAVAKVAMDGTVDGLDETCERCRCVPQCRAVFLLLALFREVTTWYREPSTSLHPKPELINLWMDYIQSSKVLTSPELKAFAQALVTNNLGPLTLRPALSSTRCVLVELTVHLAAVLLCGNQGILGPLKQLALTPANMQAAFLPSMPEDKVTMAQQAMGQGLRWYNCPNGHPCAIGECGQPMETSRCVDCGAQIGGINHIPAEGFHTTQAQADRTQTGHILGDPRRRDSPDMLDSKSLSPVPFAVVRMVTHMAMLFGLCENRQIISGIIKPQVADPGEFLLAHLREDQEHLIKSLGKGADDTVSSVHLIISSLLHPPQQPTWPVGYDNQLSTNQKRNNWETGMSNIITPQLKNLDRQLKEVNTFIRSDERISASPVMKVMFGDPRLFLGSLPENSLIHCSTVWSCREKVSLSGLSHILEHNDGKDTLPVLWRFLHREAEYRLVKCLPDILTLQKNLVKKFQNVGELGGTIAEFLQNQRSVSLRTWYENHIKIVLTTWNQLRVFLANNGEIKLPPDLCMRDLDLSCDFRVLLPGRRGPGLCSTALVSYLIALHNDLVYSVDKLTGEETSYKVSPADLTDLHVIRYELDRDLMPLVLSNTQYSIEKGQETLHEYDLPKIQQQIVSRFLLGKPLITLYGIPTLVNRHERNYEIILKDVKKKIKQEPLQTLTQFAVSTELDSYSEVCDALSTVEIALGFLPKTGGDPCMQFSCYLEEVLKMSNQTPPHILKALSMCSLKHCAALWQLLGSLKSQGLLKLKRDPFGDVSKEYKQDLGVDERRLLTGFFSKNSADSFLLEMHEFLVLELNKPEATDVFKPEWGLKDTLVSYMERKDMDIPPDVEELFPEEICLSHYVEAWKFCVSFKQERTLRS